MSGQWVVVYICIMYFKIHVSGKLCSDLGSRAGCGPQWELTDVFWEKLSLKLPSWFKDTTGLYLLKGEDKGDSMPLSEHGIYMYTWHSKCILEYDMHHKKLTCINLSMYTMYVYTCIGDSMWTVANVFHCTWLVEVSWAEFVTDRDDTQNMYALGDSAVYTWI